jgi:hypothetical protein
MVCNPEINAAHCLLLLFYLQGILFLPCVAVAAGASKLFSPFHELLMNYPWLYHEVTIK